MMKSRFKCQDLNFLFVGRAGLKILAANSKLKKPTLAWDMFVTLSKVSGELWR